MSLHVVVQMKRGKGELWEIHVPDAEGEDDAKKRAEGLAPANGDGWKVSKVTIVEPETAE